VYDLGLAHGQAGILYFLGKCYVAGIQPAHCRELIVGGCKFFNNMIQDHTTAGSFFTYSILTSEYDNRKKYPVRSRLAWCFGDLGILHTLVLVSGWIEVADSYIQYKQMLLATAERRDPGNTIIEDAQFCHGASGVGYLFLSLHKLCGNPAFKEAADYWMREA